MNRYYLLRRSSDPRVLGVKNGIKQANIDRTGFRNPEKFDQLKECLGTNKYWEIKDSVVNMHFELQCVRMLPEAKLTDFLQFGPALMNCPFLVSEKLASHLGFYETLNCRLFPAIVDSREGEFKYYLFYIDSIPYEGTVDFSKSVFFTGSEISGKKFITFNSAGERADFLKKNHILLEEERICLASQFSSSPDLFAVGSQVIVSERLKTNLEDFSLNSGVTLLPAFGEVPWTKISLQEEPDGGFK